MFTPSETLDPTVACILPLGKVSEVKTKQKMASKKKSAQDYITKNKNVVQQKSSVSLLEQIAPQFVACHGTHR